MFGLLDAVGTSNHWRWKDLYVFDQAGIVNG